MRSHAYAPALSPARLWGLLVALVLALGIALAGAVPARADSLVPSLVVQGFQGGVGWRAPVGDNGSTGGDGLSRPLQQVRISLDVPGDGPSAVSYQVCQNGEWLAPVVNGEMAGVQGTSIQGLRVRLTGDAANRFDVAYRACVAGVGWLGWTSNGQDSGAPGVGALEAVETRLVPKGGSLPTGGGSPILEPAQLQFSGFVASTGWDGPKGSGEGIGTDGQALHGLKVQLAGDNRPNGTVRYRVYTGSDWKPWVVDGQEACPISDVEPIQAVELQLDGTVAQFYDLWYRLFVPGYGWLGCTKDGNTAGTINFDQAADAIQLWLLPKNSPAPAPIENPFHSAFKSGDAELDNIVATIIKNVSGRDSGALRRAYNYVATYRYLYMDIYPTGDWSPLFAKQMYQQQGGNCYRYAALFREIARGLGYKARVVSGAVPTRSNPAAAHGWCEIEIDGQLYLFDPDMAHEYPGYDFFQRTYDNPPINYIIYERGPW